MPVPKSKPVEEVTLTPNNTGIAGPLGETEPLTAPVVTPNDMIQATHTTVEGSAGSVVGTGATEATEAPEKPRRGRQKGAPAPPPFDQQMFFIVRAQARKLASQQVAAGLPDNVDPAKLFEAVKSYKGFEGVDINRLKSKYKEGLKQIAGHAKGEEVNSQGLEHPLYLPPLSESRAKIDYLALEEE